MKTISKSKARSRRMMIRGCLRWSLYAAVLLFRHVLGVKEVDLRNKALILSEDAGTGIDWAQGAITIGTETLRVRIDKEHPKPAIIR